MRGSPYPGRTGKPRVGIEVFRGFGEYCRSGRIYGMDGEGDGEGDRSGSERAKGSEEEWGSYRLEADLDVLAAAQGGMCLSCLSVWQSRLFVKRYV